MRRRHHGVGRRATPTRDTEVSAFGSDERIRIEQHGPLGLVWIAGWLFTIGFLGLSFGRGVLAPVIWPYYLGTALAPLLP